MAVRPIDANALMDFAQNHVNRTVDCNDIARFPTLDYVPVVHGYWKHEEPVKDDGQKPFVCSTCGLRHPRYGDVDKAYFSYCPWCGTSMDAEMDGGKKDG